MKKGMAIETLGKLILLLITLLLIILFLIHTKEGGSGVIKNFFGFLRS